MVLGTKSPHLRRRNSEGDPPRVGLSIFDQMEVTMKTEGLNFLEAVKALANGECEAIESCEGFRYRFDLDILEGYHKEELNKFFDTYLDKTELLGEWKLVNPVIRPMAGEIWKRNGAIYFVYESTRKELLVINAYGNWYRIGDIQHNKNGWRLVWSPHREALEK